MRFTPRKLQLLLVSAVALAATLAPAEPALAVSPPTNIAVDFHDSGATISWTMAPGVQGYAITIREIGTHRRYGQELVLGNRWDAPYTDFPGYGRWKKGYTFQICSIKGNDSRAACTSANDGFYVHSAGDGVSTDSPQSAAHKASSCLAKGGKAVIVTAAGGGYLAALVSWIPGVDAITAADVGINVAKSGATTFMACVIA
jgi:hypothetical protein